MNKWFGYGSILMLIIGVMIGLVPKNADAANCDLEKLLPLSSQLIASDQKVIVKHASSYKPYKDQYDFLLTGQELSSKLQLPESRDIQDGPDHLLYKASSADPDGVEVTLLLIGFPDGGSKLIASAEAEGTHAVESIRRAQQDLTRRLENASVHPQWNVMIQGTAAAKGSDPDALSSWLTQQLQAQEIARYEDTGSRSVSYRSPALSIPLSAPGEKKMNLQVAVHRNSITQQQRITIGVPAISIEY